MQHRGRQTHAAPWKSGASAPRQASQKQPGFSPRWTGSLIPHKKTTTAAKSRLDGARPTRPSKGRSSTLVPASRTKTAAAIPTQRKPSQARAPSWKKDAPAAPWKSGASAPRGASQKVTRLQTHAALKGPLFHVRATVQNEKRCSDPHAEKPIPSSRTVVKEGHPHNRGRAALQRRVERPKRKRASAPVDVFPRHDEEPREGHDFSRTASRPQ